MGRAWIRFVSRLLGGRASTRVSGAVRGGAGRSLVRVGTASLSRASLLSRGRGRLSHGKGQSRRKIADGDTSYDRSGGPNCGDAGSHGAGQWKQPKGEERVIMKVPRDMDDAKALGKVLSKYKDTFYVQVLVAYFATYIFLQTFAIPGSIFLSILSGFLYPFPLALFLVCLCSGLGASFCYMLSYLVGRPVVYKYLTEKVVKWSQQVERHREHLINYIIFLRITPFLPNWFINITSPVINVPLKVFFIGTFLGVAPPSFVAIKAGTTLYQLTTAGEAVSWNSVFVLMFLALLSILPAIFQKKLKQKFE
ncbi:transmembrane protein 41B isoform X2 [Pteropus medius]|uniref:transmembrane protein 41B isoform X2 n=1 Tax=Pteropus vampyrus TaxID=132908 RepID=UPI00196A7BCA|nr:transmembrane protein 41B isoform X2 [Pteropus giganteus]